jgi:hypothetical protein
LLRCILLYEVLALDLAPFESIDEWAERMKTGLQPGWPIPADQPSLAPSRRFTPQYGRDELGFLDPARSISLLDAEGLLEHSAVLIKAQPWMGKTTFARQMHVWLSENAARKSQFGSFSELTCFEECVSVQQLLPAWWSGWKSSLPGTNACWIIDGLDECEGDHQGVGRRIVRVIADVPASTHRKHLRLIVLSRDRDWLKDFEDELRPLYAELGTDGPLLLRMAPLDRDGAARVLGSRAAFERVADIIERHDGLAGIAGYPRVLKFLGTCEGQGPLSGTDVWKAILEDLLQEHNHVKRGRLQTELEDRFEAVARLAAVCLVSGQHEVSGSDSRRQALTLGDVFPLTPLTARPKTMREAVRESIRIGGPFRSSIEGGFRFAHRNIRDWFCAFGLRCIELEQLRAVVSDEHGPQSYLVDMLHLLKQVSEEPNVRAWLTSILVPLGPSSADALWGLEEALQQIDRLEAIASQSPSNLYIYDDEQLIRLEAPGLGKRIADRLKDVNRPTTVRKLLMAFARALKTPEAVAPALEIILGKTQEIRLREWAAILVRQLGTAEDAARLDGPIARSGGKSEDERSLRAQVILTLLVHGIWSVQKAARYAPRENPQVMDTTSYLFYEMEKRVTVDDARCFASDYLDSKRRGKRRDGGEASRPSHRQKQLQVACIKKLVEEPRLSRTDLALLARLSIRAWADPEEHDLHDLILDRLRRQAFGRRWLYRRFVSNVKKGNPRPFFYLRTILKYQDLLWMLARAESQWSSIPYVWADLYFLATSARKQGTVDEVTVQGVIEAVARHAPTIPEEFERVKRELEQQESQIKAERQRRHGNAQRQAIAEVVDLVLHRDDWTDVDRMRQLSLLCFSGDSWRYQDVDGNWGDLEENHQRRVLEACKNGLREGTPTPFPVDKAFTTWNLAEAHAFIAGLTSWPSGEWLDGGTIEKWLPSVLRAHVPKALDAVIACAGKDRQATTAVVIAMIEEEVTRGENHMFFANVIPAELWPGAVAQRVASFGEDESLPPSTRAGLLEVLATYASSSALPLAVSWTENNGGGEGATVLYRKALDVRLALDPQGAWPHIEVDYQRRGADALRCLLSLRQRQAEFGANLSQWPTPQLERLAQMLLETFPLPADAERPPEGFVMMGIDDDLKETRNRVISTLVRRRLDGDSHALASLFEIEPRLKDRFEWEKQQSEASQLLGVLGQRLTSESSLSATTGIPVEQVVRLLDNADYRLIRSADDLLKAVVHVLRQAEEGAPYDVSMLYGRSAENPDRGIKGKAGKKRARRRLEEHALQAYVRRRLEDMLPSRIPGIQISIYREPEVKYQRRFVLEVAAPTINRQLARIVVEIKWSDNKDIKSSLENQLVRNYLIGHRLSHGIYLVGWCGAWGETNKKRAEIQLLKSYLADQVKSVNASEEGKNLKLETVVLDLRWRDDLPEQPAGSVPWAPPDRAGNSKPTSRIEP